MNSSLLATIHLISVNLFLLIYLVKTILIFSNQNALLKFTSATRVIEMIVSTLFLITGIWLFFILGSIKVLQIVKLACVFAAIPLAIIGYKKMKKGLALFSFVLILAAYGLAESAKSKPFLANNVEVTGATGSTLSPGVLGVKTYVANCSVCHGMDGKKKYRGAPDLSASQHDIASVPLLIKEGSKDENGTMPAFASTLSDAEITAVATYVVTLRK